MRIDEFVFVGGGLGGSIDAVGKLGLSSRHHL